jgi:hypothetical protein
LGYIVEKAQKFFFQAQNAECLSFSACLTTAFSEDRDKCASRDP